MNAGEMSFGDALTAMRAGKAVRLPHWKPDENSKMTAPYLYVESRFGRVPWNPTQIELLSMEWQIATVEDAD